MRRTAKYGSKKITTTGSLVAAEGNAIEIIEDATFTTLNEEGIVDPLTLHGISGAQSAGEEIFAKTKFTGVNLASGVIRVGGYKLNPRVTSIPFLLTSTGNGTGVSTLTLTTSKDTLITLDGTARFYSDAGGTLNESTSYTYVTGASTRYIRCPSDTSNMIIATNTITSWGEWVSGTNAASLSGDISKLNALTVLNVQGLNTLSGDIAALISLTYIKLYGTNTLSGSLSGLAALTYLYISGSNTLSGSLSGLTSLTYIRILGSNIISGSIDALTSLTYLRVEGSNTISGDMSLISAGIIYCKCIGDNQVVTYTSGGDWSSILAQGTITVNPAGGYGLTEAEVDLFIIEVEDTRAVDRHLHLTLTGSNAPRSAASDAAVAAIIADGGTVTTNP